MRRPAGRRGRWHLVEGGLGGDAKVDAPDVALVEDVRGAHLEDDREAEVCGRIRRLFVDGDPRCLQIPRVLRGAEPRHREVHVGVRGLARDPGGEGRLHQGRVPPDRPLEADEASVVAVRRGEPDCLVEQARSVEGLPFTSIRLRPAANGTSSSIRRCAASGIGRTESPHALVSSAISTPTPPRKVTIATLSFAVRVPMT